MAWMRVPGSRAGILKAAARLEALVAVGDPEVLGIVVGRFSQGGAVALTAGLRCPSKNIEAVVGTSTWLPLGDSYPDALADGASRTGVITSSRRHAGRPNVCGAGVQGTVENWGSVSFDLPAWPTRPP